MPLVVYVYGLVVGDVKGSINAACALSADDDDAVAREVVDEEGKEKGRCERRRTASVMVG